MPDAKKKTCPECEKEIDASAEECPSCKFPLVTFGAYMRMRAAERKQREAEQAERSAAEKANDEARRKARGPAFWPEGKGKGG